MSQSTETCLRVINLGYTPKSATELVELATQERVSFAGKAWRHEQLDALASPNRLTLKVLRQKLLYQVGRWKVCIWP